MANLQEWMDEQKKAQTAAQIPTQPMFSANEPEKELLMKALLTFAPAVIGGAFGGYKGGQLGADVGTGALQTLTVEEKNKRLAAKEKEKEAIAKQEKEFERLAKIEDLKLKKEEMERKSKESGADRELKMKEIAGNATTKQNKATAEQFDVASKMRAERSNNPTTKATQEVTQGYSKVLGSTANPSAAGDISLLYGFMKMLDPGSTVREGEYASAKNAAGVPEKIMASYNRAMSGETLTPSQRKDFLNQAHAAYKAQTSVQQKIDEKYQQLAKAYGIDPELVLMHYEPQSVANFGKQREEQLATIEEPKKEGSFLDGLFAKKAVASKPVINKDEIDKRVNGMTTEQLEQYLNLKRK